MPMGPVKVVFACIRNSGRSPMAGAFFNRVADPSLAYAVSAGTDPGSKVHPEVVAAMKEIGFDLTRERPRILTDEIAYRAAWIITMGCGESCPVVPGAQRDDWPIQDPHEQELATVRRIRDEVRARVQAFVDAHAWGRKTANKA